MFGEYAEVYAANQVINNNGERTTSAIALYPSGNQQEGWMFMSLSTGRVLHRQQWKRLPINQDIIDMVDQLDDRDKQTVI